MLHCGNVLFALRSEASLREPAVRGNAMRYRDDGSGFQIVKEQGVIARAKHRGLRHRLRFARHTMRVPSKSTERKQPCCLTRSSTGSVMR